MSDPNDEVNSSLELKPPVPDSRPQVDVSGFVSKYLLLRAKKDELKDKHKAELRPINDMLEKLEGAFNQVMTDLKLDSLPTSVGTPYKSSRDSATLEDPEAFRNYIIKTGKWELADIKANAPQVREFLTAEKALPPGVRFGSMVTVNVRKK